MTEPSRDYTKAVQAIPPTLRQRLASLVDFWREHHTTGGIPFGEVSKLLSEEVTLEQTLPTRDDLRQSVAVLKTARTKWLESFGVPISHEFAEFAEAIGKLTDLAEFVTLEQTLQEQDK